MTTYNQLTPLSGHARAIVKALLLDGPRSRTDLATSLDLSAGSLTRLTKPMLEEGLIIEHPNVDTPSGIGRPSVPLAFNHAKFRFIGIKLTKTDIYAALTLADARIESLLSHTLPHNDIEQTVALIAEMVQELKTHTDIPIHAIGLTLGGHVENFNYVTHADHLGWNDLPLGTLVAEATGIQTVVENDIIAHTEATHWFGEGVGTETFALFTLGAGIGYGLITHGQVVTSNESGYSLASHLPVGSDALNNYATQLRELAPHAADDVFRSDCGHVACATAMLTLGELEARATRVLKRDVTFEQLLGLSTAGDPAAALLVDASGYALGTLFASIANLTMPQRIVVGGEAVALASVAQNSVLSGLHDNRDSRATDPELRFQDSNLALWTKGAAVVAMHNTLVGR